MSGLLGIVQLLGMESARFSPTPLSPRRIIVGKTPVITLCRNGKAAFEIVRPKNAAAMPAAIELADKLHKITGLEVNLVAAASGQNPAFYLGKCPEADKLGLIPEKLDRDGYYIKTSGNNIFIVGCDSNALGDPQMATLFGVYDFLERFGGVRYYFPGDIGTVVPQKRDWMLPEIDMTERPDNPYRHAYCVPVKELGDPKMFTYPGITQKQLLIQAASIWRDSTFKIPNCHGLTTLELPQRFAKSHPEYFALTEAGTRADGSLTKTSYHQYGYLCFSSEELKNEIYLDCKACLTGEPASSRGISRWARMFHSPFVNVMPNDGMWWCQCPKCKAVERQGKQAKSDHIWHFKTDIARKLKENKIPGYVTCMAYAEYKPIPNCDIPDNVIVMLALTGPWAESDAERRTASDRLLLDWNKKLGARSYLWTYPTKLCAEVPLIPNFSPRAVGSFFKRQAPHIFGAFLEAESDRWIFSFLNCYIFSKIMWNVNTDTESLIDEHCRLMYGKAAPQMQEFYATLERLWMTGIVREQVEMPWGPVCLMPTQRELWSHIYSPQEITRVNKLFDMAEKAVSDDPMSLKRVKFMHSQMWSPVIMGAEGYLRSASDRAAWTLHVPETQGVNFDGKLDEPSWQKAETVSLVPRSGSAGVEVQTRVKMLRDKDYFYVGFEAEEPHTEAMIASTVRQPDDTELWRDNGIEVFLSDSVTSNFIYQFIVNSSGLRADLRNTKTPDTKYDSGFEVKTAVMPGKMWTAEIRIPQKSMPELAGQETIVGNFTRHRVLSGQKVNVAFYAWHPWTRNIPENCGTIRLAEPGAQKSLIKDGDFAQPIHAGRFIGPGDWGSDKVIYRDTQIFVTSGASLRLEGDGYWLRQNIKNLKPSTEYRISFFVRSEALSIPGMRVIMRFGDGTTDTTQYLLGSWKDTIRGDMPWTRIERTFKSPAVFGTRFPPHLEFRTGAGSAGKCYIDHVELFEVTSSEKKADQ